MFCSDAVDHTPEKAQSFIQEAVDSNTDRPIRGPYLAQLELIKQLQVSIEEPQRDYGRFLYGLHHEKNFFLHMRSKGCMVAGQLISALFSLLIVISLHFLNKKFHSSSHLLWLYSQFVSDLVFHNNLTRFRSCRQW